MRTILPLILIFSLPVCLTSGGCDYDPSSPLFSQKYDSSSPAQFWSWEWLDQISTVENTVGWPAYQWMPDAHMSAVKDEDSEVWYTFYPNSGSYRTRGSVPFPDWAEELNPANAVVGGPRVEEDVYDNGGDWLMAIHPSGPEQSLTGFIHAEDHFWRDGFPGYTAYKSIALACSQDYGETWAKQGQIVTVGEKPEAPEWSGVGDFDAIWDWQEERWFMATGGPSGAVSYDKGASAETWKKWDGSNFTRSNWVEPMEVFKDTNGEDLPHGERIGLMWNSYIQKWLMVWNAWDGNIYLASAARLPYWDHPRLLVSPFPGHHLCCATLFSDFGGTYLGDRDLSLYFADQYDGKRDFLKWNFRISSFEV